MAIRATSPSGACELCKERATVLVSVIVWVVGGSPGFISASHRGEFTSDNLCMPAGLCGQPRHGAGSELNRHLLGEWCCHCCSTLGTVTCADSWERGRALRNKMHKSTLVSVHCRKQHLHPVQPAGVTLPSPFPGSLPASDSWLQVGQSQTLWLFGDGLSLSVYQPFE